MEEGAEGAQEFTRELAFAKMPFGKYKGWFLTDIPEPYYVWFRKKGFPQGKLGRQLEAMYEIKLNGLEGVMKELRMRLG